MAAIWLLAGTLVGGGIAVTVMSAMRPPAASNIVVQRGNNEKTPIDPSKRAEQETPQEPTILVPKDQSSPVANPNAYSQNAEYAADKKPGEGATNLPQQPKPLPGGSIGTGGMTEPISPVVVIGDPPPAQVDHFEFVETMAETEFDGELGQAVAAIRKAGGQVLAQFARDPDRPERGMELYAAIDFKDAPKLREALKLAAGSETSHWSGTNGERSSRMLRSIREERSRLAQKLVEYQTHYLDEASQVVDTKAAIERCDKAIGALGQVGVGKTTFKLTLGR